MRCRRRSPLLLLAGAAVACGAALLAGHLLERRSPEAAGPFPDSFEVDRSQPSGWPDDPEGGAGDSEDPAAGELLDWESAGDAPGAGGGARGGEGEDWETGAGAGGRGAALGAGTGRGVAPGASARVAAAGSDGGGRRSVTATAQGGGASDGGGAETPAAEPPALLSGRVSDPDGAAIAAAGVKLISGRRTYHQVATDDDGRFRIDEVRPGRYLLRARAGGFLDGGPPAPIDLAPAEVLCLPDVVLRPSGLAAGRVLDPRGDPVAGARVFADRSGAFGRIETRTGGEGRFELSGLPPVRTTLRAEAEGFLPARPVTIRIPTLEDGSPGLVEGIVLTLVEGAAIEGDILGPDGSPIALRVWLHDAGGRRLKGSAGDPAYRFEGLAAGRYQLVTDPAGPPFAGAVAREEVVLAASEARRLDLILASGGSVAGRCVGEDGAPVRGVRVSASAQGIWFSRSAISGADGRFAIGGLFDGAYSVTARPPEGYASPDPLAIAISGQGGPDDLVFEIPAGAILTGRAIAGDGGPGSGARVSAWDAARGALLGAADADPAGRFRLVRLPPGDIDVYAHGTGELARTGVRLEAGEVRALDVPLAPPGRLRGAVRTSSGAAASRALVEARSVEGIVRRTCRAARSGAFEVGDLYPGRYVLTARLGPAASPPLERDVGLSQTVEGADLVVRE